MRENIYSATHLHKLYTCHHNWDPRAATIKLITNVNIKSRELNYIYVIYEYYNMYII